MLEAGDTIPKIGRAKFVFAWIAIATWMLRQIRNCVHPFGDVQACGSRFRPYVRYCAGLKVSRTDCILWTPSLLLLPWRPGQKEQTSCLQEPFWKATRGARKLQQLTNPADKRTSDWRRMQVGWQMLKRGDWSKLTNKKAVKVQVTLVYWNLNWWPNYSNIASCHIDHYL